MSIPASDAALKDYLIVHDETYRELVNEHKQYESRLNELSEIHYPSVEEQVEETVLKKKKLLLKDQMEAIASRYKASASSATSH
ncbi:MAG: DUF465 domain-containing protein [Acidobacteriota bacterium]|nr:MAG: DUF465 domain-containing protein [Acidobacteriota bacterium]